MITEFIIFAFLDFFDRLIYLLPFTENIIIPAKAISTLVEFTSVCDYFLPLNWLFRLLLMRIFLDCADFAFKIIFRIKSFIPTMGN